MIGWTPGDGSLDRWLEEPYARMDFSDRECPCCAGVADTDEGDCTTCRDRDTDYDRLRECADIIREVEASARRRGDTMDASMFCAAARILEDVTFIARSESAK